VTKQADDLEEREGHAALCLDTWDKLIKAGKSAEAAKLLRSFSPEVRADMKALAKRLTSREN
jgi:hypothetical protein